jgi:hypothetical protein
MPLFKEKINFVKFSTLVQIYVNKCNNQINSIFVSKFTQLKVNTV